MILVIIGTLVVVLCLSVLAYAKRHLEQLPLVYRTVEVADRETVGILVLYLLPLLKTSFVELELLVLVPAGVIFLALALTRYNFHFNPLLIILGWKFYKVGTPEGVTYILITRKTLRGPANRLIVGQLTGYTLVELESAKEKE